MQSCWTIEKDLLQAVQVLEVLVEDRPGALALAWDALEPLGASVRKGIARGLAAVEARARAFQAHPPGRRKVNHSAHDEVLHPGHVVWRGRVDLG